MATVIRTLVALAGVSVVLLGTIAAAPPMHHREPPTPRPILWVGVTGEKECHDSTDAGILHFPLDPSSPYGEARFSPYYLSGTGTVSVVAFANAHSSNSSIAAVIGVINSYSNLQANIGAHDPNDLRLLALYRLMGNIPGTDVPPPAPGTVASLLAPCAFGADPDGIIRLH